MIVPGGSGGVDSSKPIHRLPSGGGTGYAPLPADRLEVGNSRYRIGERIRDLGAALKTKASFLKQPEDPVAATALAASKRMALQLTSLSNKQLAALPNTFLASIGQYLLTRAEGKLDELGTDQLARVLTCKGTDLAHVDPIAAQMKDSATAYRVLRRWQLDQELPVLPTRTPGDWDGLTKYLDVATGTVARPGCDMVPLVDGTTAFPAMLDAIDKARDNINWTIHIFDPDKSGWEVAKHLAEAAQRGCKVRLLLDEVGAGSALRSPEGRRLLNFLTENGVQLKTQEAAPRSCNHRKVLVTDGEQAFTGGMNVGHFDEHYSHDVHSVVTGPAVADLQSGFEKQWLQAGGILDPSERQAMYPQLGPAGDIPVRVLHHEGNKDRNIKLAYLAAIETAEHSITLANPYFTDEDILTKLKEAAARGVEVKVIFPHNNDYKLMEHSGRSYYKDFLEAGIQVYEYKGDGMSHHKVAVFDHRYCTIGTSNLDRLSMECNDEVNLWMDDKEAASRLDSILQDDMKNSLPIEGYRPGLVQGAVNQVSNWLIRKL